jgi:hypothetical protein
MAIIKIATACGLMASEWRVYAVGTVLAVGGRLEHLCHASAPYIVTDLYTTIIS